MINYCILFTVLIQFFLVQAQEESGNVLPKSYASLPQEPSSLASKAAATNCGCSRTLTFDDITSAANAQLGTIPNGYGGFTWVNGIYMNSTWEMVTYGWNGYATGRNSGVFVGVNGQGQLMSMNVPVGQYFQLNSLVLAAAWNNDLTLTIKGSRAGVDLYQAIAILQVTSKTTLSTMNWSGIDTVTFNSTGGTPYPGLSGIGTQFAVDDINLSM